MVHLYSRWQALRARGGEAGSGGGVSLMLIIATFALIIVTGLVVDGGAQAAAADRASRLAAEAARSGLQVANLNDGGQLSDEVVNAEVDRYLTAAGVSGTTRVNGTEVIVIVVITGDTQLLSLMGVDHFTATGTGTADGLYR